MLTAVVQIVARRRACSSCSASAARCSCLPLLALAGYGASAVLPALAIVAAVKVVENSTDYSLQNTLQQALFLPTSRDAKYKAKSAIDTLSVRLGDLVSTGLVFVGAQLHLCMLGFAVANVVAGGWSGSGSARPARAASTRSGSAGGDDGTAVSAGSPASRTPCPSPSIACKRQLVARHGHVDEVDDRVEKAVKPDVPTERTPTPPPPVTT